MKTTQALPENYEEILSVDLQKNKKLAIIINLLAFLIAVLMVVLRLPSLPFSALFDMSEGLWMYFLRFFSLLVGLVLYIILHEVTHGIAMRAFGAKHVRFGFTGLYAYAGSREDYFGKGPYLVIALAPVVLFFVLFLLLELLLPVNEGWRWIIYLLQIQNLSGAAGDLYVSLRFLTLSKDILVYDEGTAMRVYARRDV